MSKIDNRRRRRGIGGSLVILLLVNMSFGVRSFQPREDNGRCREMIEDRKVGGGTVGRLVVGEEFPRAALDRGA